jgi:hypothetical protein
MRDLEHQIAVAFMHWWTYYARSKKIDETLLFHIPNGGLRNRATAGKLKAEGVRAGVSDYLLAMPRGTYHGLFLELKKGGPGIEKGRATKEQLDFGEKVKAQGFAFTVACGTDEAVEKLLAYLRLSAA